MKTKSKLKITLLAMLCVGNAIAQTAPSTSQETTLTPSSAQEANENSSNVAIAKELANPVSTMRSLPFQWNYTPIYTDGQGSASRQTLLFQPAIPMALENGDAFITRPIFTGIYAKRADGSTDTGMGNIQIESFYAPKPKAGAPMWGVGPYLSLPADAQWGSQQTGLGLAGVLVNRSGPWTYGGLMFRSWNVGGSPDSGTANNLYFQLFASYITESAYTFNLSAQPNYNFDTKYTVQPYNFTVSKSVKLGGSHVQLVAGTTYTVRDKVGAPGGWGGRIGMTYVFPK